MSSSWQRNGNHVWYFADVDEIATVDEEQHWYWGWFCKKPEHVIYLGVLWKELE